MKHKALKKDFWKGYGLILLIMLLLSTAWLSLRPDPLQRHANTLKAEIHDRLRQIEQFSKDKAFFKKLQVQEAPGAHFRQQYGQGWFGVVLYKNMPIFWSDNAIKPTELQGIKTGTHFVRLRNGYYVVEARAHAPYIVYGCIKVRPAYNIENQYLRNHVSACFDVPDWLLVHAHQVGDAWAVKDRQGEPLFYVTALGQAITGHIPPWLLLGFTLYLALGMLAVLTWLFQLLIRYRQPLLALLAAGGLLYLIRLVMITYHVPFYLYEMPLFQPHHYAASTFLHSLGDLLLNAVLCVWLAYWCYRYRLFFYKQIAWLFRAVSHHIALRITASCLLISLGFLLAWEITHITGGIITHSRLSFDIQNLYEFGWMQYISLLAISLFLLMLFWVCSILTGAIRRLTTGKSAMPLYLLTLLAWVIGCIGHEMPMPYWYALGWAAGGMLFQYYGLRWRPSFSLAILGVLYMAILPAITLHGAYKSKELENRKMLAQTLADEPDPIAEYLLQDIVQRIRNDVFIKKTIHNPVLPANLITDRLLQYYFSGYFNKFEAEVFKVPIQEGFDSPAPWLEQRLPQKGFLVEQTGSHAWHFMSRTGYSSGYVLQIPIVDESGRTIAIQILLRQKILHRPNVYPELLLDHSVPTYPVTGDYAYAIYQNKSLLTRHGNYAYSFIPEFFNVASGQYAMETRGGYNHLIYSAVPNQIIVVSRKQKGQILLPFYSFLFCFLLFIGLLLYLLYQAGQVCRIWLLTGHISDIGNRLFHITFRERIQGAIMLVIVFSFIFLGWTTVHNVEKEFNTYHDNRIIRKKRAVSTDAELELEQSNYSGLQEQVNDIAPRLARTHAIDVNIFDLDGTLVASSQPDIFDKGLIAPLIEPAALFKLREMLKTYVVQDERIGALDFRAVYVPIRDKDGQVRAILNLPYYANQKDFYKDVSAILTNLMGVYMLIFVLASLAAVFLGQQITRQLTQLSEKLKSVRLRESNPPIQWQSKDEIGVLVAAYNRMVEELAHSAEMLVQSEREAAWRKMARQVAHEIKNPLTPMKLSVQRLQRNMQEKKQDPALARQVTNTLLEQIDQLAEIASAFHAFARMPQPKDERIAVNEVIKKAVALYKGEEETRLTTQLPNQKIWVRGDASHLQRVLANLIQNALQAIPADRKGLISLALQTENDKVCIRVSDNGLGIPEEMRKKIYEPSFTTKGSGMGLGLAMARNIIESFGGTITFQTKMDEGTTFMIRLPRYEA